MRKGYGNYFSDTAEILCCEVLRERSTKGCELSSRKLSDLICKGSDDYDEITEILLSVERENNEIKFLNIQSMRRNILERTSMFQLNNVARYNGMKCVIKILKAEESNNPQEKLKALAYLRYMYFNAFGENYNRMSQVICSVYGSRVIDISSLNESELGDFIYWWSLVTIIERLMRGLTLREVLTIFPLKKVYKGDKFGTKDYYSSMDIVKEIGLDTILTPELAMDFITDCATDKFMFRIGVNMMRLVSDSNGWSMEDVMCLMKEVSKPKLTVVKQD